MKWIATAVAAAAILLAGCQAWPPDTVREVAPRYSNPDGHLLYLDRLADADEAAMRAKGEILRRVVGDEPSADQRLRYALWIGQPGHEGYDPAAAIELLDALLAEPGRGLMPASHALARAERRRLADRQAFEREIGELEHKLRSLTDLERELEGSRE